MLLGMTGTHAQWTGMPDGPNEHVRALCYDSINDRLYAFGRFLEAGGQVVNGTTFLENGEWEPMGDGVDQVFAWSVMAAYLHRDSVMISGSFETVLGVSNTRRIALWNGNQWQSIGGVGADQGVWGILANDDGWTLASGFTEIGGIDSHGIARYRDGDWEDLCLYPDNEGYKVYTAIAKYQEQYIFGGNINGDFPDLNEIGVLENDSLRPMANGILGDSWVNDMLVYDDKLFVTGEFYAGWGNPGSGIMTWNGTQWADPIPGVICASQGLDLDIFDGKLFFSGYMLLPGSTDFYTLAMYTPGEICLFGKNLNAAMRVISGVPGGLVVAPNYSELIVDGVPLGFLAFYDITQGFDTCLTLPVNVGELSGINVHQLTIYPNPSNGVFQVELPDGFKAERIVMFDALGNEIGLSIRSNAWNSRSISIDPLGYVPGIYVVRVCESDGATCFSGRVILHR